MPDNPPPAHTHSPDCIRPWPHNGLCLTINGFRYHA